MDWDQQHCGLWMHSRAGTSHRLLAVASRWAFSGSPLRMAVTVAACLFDWHCTHCRALARRCCVSQSWLATRFRVFPPNAGATRNLLGKEYAWRLAQVDPSRKHVVGGDQHFLVCIADLGSRPDGTTKIRSAGGIKLTPSTLSAPLLAAALPAAGHHLQVHV